MLGLLVTFSQDTLVDVEPPLPPLPPVAEIFITLVYSLTSASKETLLPAINPIVSAVPSDIVSKDSPAELNSLILFILLLEPLPLPPPVGIPTSTQPLLEFVVIVGFVPVIPMKRNLVAFTQLSFSPEYSGVCATCI